MMVVRYMVEKLQNAVLFVVDLPLRSYNPTIASLAIRVFFFPRSNSRYLV